MKLSKEKRIEIIREQVHIARTVDTQRAKLVTESYKETEGQHMAVRRAKALEKILSQMPIYIHHGQLIVGNQGEKSRAGLIFPEFQWETTLNEMATWQTRPGDKFIISDEQQAELKEILQYWKGKTVKDIAWAAFPDELKNALKMGVMSNANYLMSGHGHFIPDFEKVLKKGFAGIRSEVEEEIKKLDISSVEYYEKYSYFKGLLITIRAASTFIKRYAVLAGLLSQSEKDEDRKAEFIQIQNNCLNIAENPAQNFWEALQLVWFVQLIPQIEVNGLAVCPGRLDQYLYPYYQRDLDAGLIDYDKALELMDCLFLQLATITKIYGNEGAMIFAGPGVGQTITISGVDEYGKDATNIISYMVLDADADVRLMQPDIAVRNHPTIPEKFLKKACAHTAAGRDKPKFFTDNVVIESLLNVGVPLKDARNYGDLGCSEIIVCGKTCSGGNMGNLDLAICLLYALKDGKQNWWYDGANFHSDVDVQVGLHTGNAREFTSYEQVEDAYVKQLNYMMKLMATMNNILDNVQGKHLPHVFYSLVTEGCIERGLDFAEGGSIYNYTSPLAVAPITTSDSLAAIKKAVFDDKYISMDELIDALDDNFASDESRRIQKILINKVPKFGNDDDFADDMASFVIRSYVESMAEFKSPRANGAYVGGAYSLTGNVGFGWRTGPTPDGRFGGELLNDNISPMQARDLNGPTAVIKSLSKVDGALLPQGYVFNLKFMPNILDDEVNLQKFVDFNRSLNDFGIFHVQYNIFDAKILIEAQKYPDKYKDLLVRVSGYSAYFVELGNDVQKHLIDRTLHEI